jgi:anionic cell wall polymer biosynthesis LytR-Cps2A-Psr (LCP) family protein
VKGIERLMDGIRDFVGFDIGSFVIVNLQAFEQLIDAIGGVDYYVPRSMYYYDGSQGLKISIPMQACST